MHWPLGLATEVEIAAHRSATSHHTERRMSQPAADKVSSCEVAKIIHCIWHLPIFMYQHEATVNQDHEPNLVTHDIKDLSTNPSTNISEKHSQQIVAENKKLNHKMRQTSSYFPHAWLQWRALMHTGMSNPRSSTVAALRKFIRHPALWNALSLASKVTVRMIDNPARQQCPDRRANYEAGWHLDRKRSR